MANQDNSDLIDNNNHIIESIQGHETRMSRQEQLKNENALRKIRKITFIHQTN